MKLSRAPLIIAAIVSSIWARRSYPFNKTPRRWTESERSMRGWELEKGSEAERSEALSVITQRYSDKWTGKRVFRMAPIHHHFEKKGWAEPKIIVRFWIMSFFLCLVALASLKLR